MLSELLKQITDRGFPSEVSSWFEKRLVKEPSVTLSQAEHVLDWIEAKKPPKLYKMRWDEALKESEKWTRAEQKKGSNIEEKKEDTKLFMKVGKYKIVQLIGQNAFKREGHLMSHCVASYYGKTGMKIYSLRDFKNEPHCTFEIVGDKNVQQVKGKGNGPIAPLYIDAVVQFLEKMGMDVRDSEMKNLGYINVDKYKKYLHKDSIKNLFREKYWNQKEKLLDEDKQEFETLDFLEETPLVSGTQTGLKLNFELKSFIKLSFDFMWKQSKKLLDKASASGDSAQLAASGDSAKLAASGHSAQLAASGDSAQLAASGDSAQLAASGDSAKLAASGDSAQLAASGHYAQLAASGDSAKLAASGHSAQLAASGDYAQLAASGHSAQLAASGHSAQLAASGHYAQLAASGDYAKLAASGHSAKLAASGHSAQLAASGDSAKLAASGHSAQLELTGNGSVGAAIGYGNIIKGKKDCWITLAEYKPGTHEVVCVKSAKIDGKELKENTWYGLENEKFVEIK